MMEQRDFEEQASSQTCHPPVTPATQAPFAWATTTAAATGAAAGQVLQQDGSPVFAHSSSIFSPEEAHGEAPSNHNLSPNSTQTFPSLQSRSSQPSALFGQNLSSSRRAPSPSTDATMKAEGARRLQMDQAEKDTDDPTASLDPRTLLQRGNSTISTRLNRLFTAGTQSSPMASREHSYGSSSDAPQPYVRSSPSETTATLPNHLYQRGLLGGRHSDINITVFGNTYRSHRIILDRAPFFASALSEPWCEASQRDVTLHPEEIDPNITKITFELALKRLYGCQDLAEEDPEATGLFATGCWLEMQDLIDSSVDALLKSLCPKNLAFMIQLVTANYYGKAGEKILASVKAMLSRDGWEMPLKYWDGIPSDVVRELVGGDGFFVSGEWDRWNLAKRLLNRRLKLAARDMGLWPLDLGSVSSEIRRRPIRPDNIEGIDVSSRATLSVISAEPLQRAFRLWMDLYSQSEISPLLTLLDEDIHYVHLEFEQLQYLRSARDIFDTPLIPAKVITDALWANFELRQTVVNSSEKELTLGLAKPAEASVSGAEGLSRDPSSELADSKSSPQFMVDENARLLESSLQDHPRRFWIPSADCNTIVGGGIDPSIGSPSAVNRHASNLSATLQNEDAQWTNDTQSDKPATPSPQTARSGQYSVFPPFRFAAQFPNPRLLKERKRVYSRTVFYAGSLWNLYIQKVKSGSKSPQLGVYLHRAKERESDDLTGTASGFLSRASVDQRIGALEREMTNRNQHSRHQRRYVWEPVADAEASGGNSSGDPDATLVSPSRPLPHAGLSTFMANTSPRKSARQSLVSHIAPSLEDSTSGSEVEVDTPSIGSASALSPPGAQVPALPPYVDVRPTIKTYFKIYGPSKGGRMLSVYESAPDNFNFSQSWGWKSSTLMVDDEEEEDGTEHNETRGGDSSVLMAVTDEGKKDWKRAKNGTLRFMVVLGVV